MFSAFQICLLQESVFNQEFNGTFAEKSVDRTAHRSKAGIRRHLLAARATSALNILHAFLWNLTNVVNVRVFLILLLFKLTECDIQSGLTYLLTNYYSLLFLYYLAKWSEKETTIALYCIRKNTFTLIRNENLIML